jgi:hypothetical protein
MAGKGDRRRKTLIPQAEADANYEAIFGKYVPLYLRKQIPADNTEQTINEISKLVADETLQATEPKAEDNK